MATYPLVLSPTFPYQDHLMYNRYVADINKGIARAAAEIAKGQAFSTMAMAETMNRNVNFLAETITSSTAILSDDIYDMRSSIEYGLERVSDGIAGLRAAFDIAMGQVITQFEMLRGEMSAGFDHIINILENRRKIEAQEHFRDALEFYHDGCRFPDKPQWFNDALKHLLASVKQYERNPLAHLHIGHIYHYQHHHMDFHKAMHHYRLCYTYGEAEKEDKAIAAQGYFYAGWLSAAAMNDTEEAIQLTKIALEYDPKLGEAHYHLAKFYSLLGEANSAIAHLERAVQDFDRNYCIKAEADPDFDKIREAVHALFEQLKQKARQQFEKALNTLDRNFEPKDKKWYLKLQAIWTEIDTVRKKDTYFAYLDNTKRAKRLADLITEAIKEREKHYDSTLKRLEQWDELMRTRVCLSKDVEAMAKKAILKATELLNQDDYTAHDEAKQLISVYSDNWDNWVTKDEYERIQRERKRKEKEEREKRELEKEKQKAEKERRKRDGLCLDCGQPVGFLLRLKSIPYCKEHWKT